MSTLSLEIITPNGHAYKADCTSVQFNVCDDLNGKHGGSYGVRPGHAKTVFALEKGVVKAYDGEQLTLKGECGNGFATVENNCVKLIVESFFKY